MPKKSETDRATLVLKHAKASVDNFFEMYDDLRTGHGAPSDNEQDLLRAALVFAAAGLDSALKELIRGSVKSLAKIDSKVQDQFETFIQRQLRTESRNVEEASSGIKFLASILASSTPQERLLDQYVFFLTGSSLQSVDQLFKSAKALGAEMKLISDSRTELSAIFDARNKIIHELDVKFTGKTGHRQRNRPRRDIVRKQCDLLLEVAESLVMKVASKLKAGAS